VPALAPKAATRTIRTRLAVDLRLTLRAGLHPPCGWAGPDGVWLATRTPGGPATLRLVPEGERCVRAQAWGEGAWVALDAAPALVGAEDDGEGLSGVPGLVGALARRRPGLRVGRTGAVMEALVPAILEQKVQGQTARRAFAALARAAARPAPGPDRRLLLPPEPSWLASLPSWGWHRFGVEHRRAATVREAARHCRRVEEVSTMEPPAARARLEALPGVGPWTSAVVAEVALGDPDAVRVGDFWLAHHVSWALAGEPRGTDERMLELLEPFRGQRGRVARLIVSAGPKLPRFGPRLPLRDIATT